MPRTGLAYERPSRVSQALILGFSLAVVVMAGWLVMMIMLPHDANTTAADPADVPAMATTPAPRIEDSVTAYDPPPAKSAQLKLSVGPRPTSNSISSFAIGATIVQPVHESDAQRYQVDGKIKKYCGGRIPSRN